MAVNTEELKSLESSASCILDTVSTLDWQATAMPHLGKEIFEEHPNPAAQRLHRLMLSSARSISHLITETSRMKANILLKRRDAALTLLPS